MQYNEIYNMCQPIMDWLKEHYPHNHKIVIDWNGAEMIECGKLVALDKGLKKIMFQKPYMPKEHEKEMQEILGMDINEIKDDCYKFMVETLQKILKCENQPEPKKNDSEKLEKRTPFTDKELVEKWKKLAEELNREFYKAIEENKRLKDELQRKEATINQIDSIICELFGIAHNGDEYTEDFKELLRNQSLVGKTIADFLPTEPIKVADILINASKKRVNCMTEKEYDKYIFEKWQIQQIAEHLLVYCNANEEGKE